MKKSSLIQAILIFLIALTSLAYFIYSSNYEFIVYVFVLVAFFYFIIYSDKWFKYPRIATWGLVIWAILHMAGGAIYIKGIRLYDIILIPLLGEPYNLFKYDQFMHFYTYLVIGILTYSILKEYFKKENALTIILAIFMVLGIGSFYELVEFSTVVMFTATGVGGYYNLMLDLFFNFLGSIAGILVGIRLKQ
jgi:uncharacterized membrane protein YjdF